MRAYTVVYVKWNSPLRSNVVLIKHILLLPEETFVSALIKESIPLDRICYVFEGSILPVEDRAWKDL